jgi:hypothetical protein
MPKPPKKRYRTEVVINGKSSQAYHNHRSHITGYRRGTTAFYGRSLPGGKEVNDLKPNYDGSYLFASMGEGSEQATCFIDTRTNVVSFEGSNAHKNELFEMAKKFLRGRKEDKK